MQKLEVQIQLPFYPRLVHHTPGFTPATSSPLPLRVAVRNLFKVHLSQSR